VRQGLLFVRSWFHRRPPDDPPSWEELLPVEAFLRAEVEDVLAIESRQIWGRSIAFGGRLRLPPGAALEELRRRLEPRGYTPFLREERGDVWVYALPRAAGRAGSRPLLHLALFLLTAFTTLMAGAFPFGDVALGELAADPGQLLRGLPFAASLLSILAVHEFGHYAFGRRHGMPVSLPYFIPAPPQIFFVGTLGAVIRLRGPVRDRRALFDMAVAGPLAGLILAVPIFVLGLHLSSVVPSPPPGGGLAIVFGDALLPKLLERLVLGTVPPGYDIALHPVGVAAWFGFLVTALNLIPAGQLDGGHIVYAMFGRRHALISKLTVAGLVAVGVALWSPTWLFWALLIVAVMGFHHGPPMDDITALDGKRRALGALALLLLPLLFPPVPLAVL
jgi:membrane-associated protease RseP (regulator of RpoE activity)